MAGRSDSDQVHKCFPGDTEVLTRRGWIAWKNVLDTDEFATWWSLAGQLQWQKALGFVKMKQANELDLDELERLEFGPQIEDGPQNAADYDRALRDAVPQLIAIARENEARKVVIANIALALFPDSPTESALAEFDLDAMGACQVIRRMRAIVLAAEKLTRMLEVTSEELIQAQRNSGWNLDFKDTILAAYMALGAYHKAEDTK